MRFVCPNCFLMCRKKGKYFNVQKFYCSKCRRNYMDSSHKLKSLKLSEKRKFIEEKMEGFDRRQKERQEFRDLMKPFLKKNKKEWEEKNKSKLK